MTVYIAVLVAGALEQLLLPDLTRAIVSLLSYLIALFNIYPSAVCRLN